MTDQIAAPRRPVPFLDLQPSHAALKGHVLAAIADLIDSGAFINGAQVAAFEAAFAAYCHAGHAIGLASGLDALRLGLIAAGVRPGDEVIVPANTFAATFEAVVQAGARPVVVDATEDDYNIDVAAAQAAVTRRSRAILPVHLYGQMADMQGIRTLARRASLLVVEDACQAHGAERDGLRAGSAGTAAAFSFYPGKNLGAFGDAGALTTGSDTVARTVRALREHGQHAKYVHDLVGYTARLDTIQAIVLDRKLPLLDSWNEERRAVAARYTAALDAIGDLVLPPVAPGSEPVWHLYPIRTADPERLAEHLASSGIRTGRHYPEPPHLARAFRDLGLGRGAFPVAEALAAEVLSLPIYPGMDEDVPFVVADAIRDYFRRA
jgi:dTDP-4-amino-4,6-dideoxygalactose transaminase